MAGVSLSDYFDKLGKNIYDPKTLENLQNMEAKTFGKLKKSSKKPDGNGVFTGVIASGNQAGQGSQNELEALRTPDYQEVQQPRIRSKVFTHTIRLSGLSMESLQGNEESFADAMTLQMDEGIKDSAKELNAQCFRTGSGIIALSNGAGSATDQLIFDTGVPTHFRYDMPLDVVLSATKEVTNIKVSDIDITNLTVTLASAQTWSTNADIYRAGVYDNSPTDGKELSGFPRITDDGTDFTAYENINRTSSSIVYPWKGLEIAAGSANLSDDLLQRAKAKMMVMSGKTPKKIISNTSQARKYLALTLPSVQFDAGKSRDTGTGQDADYLWNGMSWVVDTDCDFGDVWMYDPEYILRFDSYDLKFDTNGGLVKWDNGYDAYVCYAKYYGNIGTWNPRAMIRITNLAQPTF